MVLRSEDVNVLPKSYSQPKMKLKNCSIERKPNINVSSVHWKSVFRLPTKVRQQTFFSSLAFLFIQLLLSNLLVLHTSETFWSVLCPLLLFQHAFYHGHQLVVEGPLIAWRPAEWHDVMAFLKAFSLLFSFLGPITLRVQIFPVFYFYQLPKIRLFLKSCSSWMHR